MKILTELFEHINASVGNKHRDNIDYRRFRKGKRNIGGLVKQPLVDMLEDRGFYRNPFNTKTIRQILENAEKLQESYDSLSDEASKKLYIEILSYRVLGHNRVRLPLSTPGYWEGLQKTERLMNESDSIETSYKGWRINRFDLSAIGYPVQLYYTAPGIYSIYTLRQYEYIHGNVHIEAKPNETVIDAGACWGDTALYFASKVGVGGKVYSVEFSPANLRIFEKNISLNPMYRDVIQIVDKPVWDVSNVPFYMKENGEASTFSEQSSDPSDIKVESLAIDDYIAQNGIPKVDFIKMDIEGAEMRAIKGALSTIQRDRPKLAITIYHSISDMACIPSFIQGLGLGYKIYIGHYTIHAEETVMFAIPG